MWDELDDRRWTIRCVRRHRDGTLAAYSYDLPHWRDVMPDGPLPPVGTLAADPQLRVRVITREDFETVWNQALASRGTRGA